MSQIAGMDTNDLDLLVNQLTNNYSIDQLYPIIATSLGYEETPPTIEEFTDSDEFLGQIFWDSKKNKSSLYSVWRGALKEIYPNPFFSPYIEVCLSGAIGTGKTTIAKIGALYDLCRLLLLKEPQYKYNLIPTTIIEYAILNVMSQLVLQKM